MEHLNDLEAAILAAGVSCVYNADDWDRHADKRSADANDGPMPESSSQH